MSVRVMAQLWDNGPEKGHELLLILALADFANDEGICWPSIGRVARKARVTPRVAQKTIRTLEASGWLKISTGGGRKSCNEYAITPVTCDTPVTYDTPVIQHPKPCHTAPETLSPVTPEPLEPSIEPSLSKNIKKPDPVFEVLSRWANCDAVSSFIAYRRKHKSKAMTETAAKRLATSLEEIFNSGGDPSDALGMAEERGWASVQPDWYFNSKQGTQNGTLNGNYNGRATNQSGMARTSKANEIADRAIRYAESRAAVGRVDPDA